MAIVILPFILFFLLSLAVGAWLGRRSAHGLWRATWPWPALTMAVAALLLVATVFRAGAHDEFLDLAVGAILLIGGISVALAWAGAVAGAMIWAGK